MQYINVSKSIGVFLFVTLATSKIEKFPEKTYR